MGTPASYRTAQTAAPTFINRVHNYIDTQPSVAKLPVKFDAAFLENRMQAHREYQARLTAELATGIILEVAIALEEL
jgi:predicted component of type VI protein secretion system